MKSTFIHLSRHPRPKGRFAATLVLAAFAGVLGATTEAMANHWVYCIHNRVRIESRPPADVGRSHIAASICTMGGPFRHVGDARSFAQNNWRGEGQSCSCR